MIANIVQMIGSIAVWNASTVTLKYDLGLQIQQWCPILGTRTEGLACCGLGFDRSDS